MLLILDRPQRTRGFDSPRLHSQNHGVEKAFDSLPLEKAEAFGLGYGGSLN